eukprot:555828-Amphidinium_carterae.1
MRSHNWAGGKFCTRLLQPQRGFVRDSSSAILAQPSVRKVRWSEQTHGAAWLHTETWHAL